MPSQEFTLVLSVVAVVISLISAFAAIGRWLVTYKQIKVQNLLNISQFLHQAELREARHAVRNSQAENLDFDGVRKVSSSFDLAALFIRHKLIDEAIFLEYWGPFLTFLRSHLSGFENQVMFGNVSFCEYYRHFYWIMDEAAKKASQPGPLA
jgi:hypothetical protein